MKYNPEHKDLDYSAKECKSGVCPVCGYPELEYGTAKTLDTCTATDWICETCISSGQEIDRLVFDGHIVKSLPEEPAPQNIYVDSAGYAYLVHRYTDFAFRGVRKLVVPGASALREKIIPSLESQEDRNIAQYQLDAYAREKGLRIITAEQMEARIAKVPTPENGKNP